MWLLIPRSKQPWQIGLNHLVIQSVFFRQGSWPHPLKLFLISSFDIPGVVDCSYGQI
jgi:hypothetical protein